MNKINITFIFFVLLAPIYAYIGPGMSGGLIVTILAIISSIFLAIFGILYYPIKRYIKKHKRK